MDAAIGPLNMFPLPWRSFGSCRKLEPGHLLRFKDGRAEVRRWWHPESAHQTGERTQARRVARLRPMLSDAVRLRLRADVPVAPQAEASVPR